MTTPTRVALITGITGQDGAYLAQFLLQKNYVICRRHVAHAAGRSARHLLVATHRSETVRHFVAMAFKAAGYDLVFEGSAEQEIARDAATGKTLVRINPRFYRPAEVGLLIGNPAKARARLGWQPSTTLEDLCQMMVREDLRRNEQGLSF